MMTTQTGGLVTATLGWLGAILTCALPIWRVMTYMGSGMAAAQMVYEGLWMNCISESTGQMQCKAYNSMLEVTPEVQGSRAMVLTSLFTAFFAFFIALLGTECTRRVDDNDKKNRFAGVAGALFVAAGIVLLVPVSWIASTILNNYNPMGVDNMRRELGAAIYIGWISSALEILGGGILCYLGTQSQQDPYSKKYNVVKTCGPVGYAMKEYM